LVINSLSDRNCGWLAIRQAGMSGRLIGWNRRRALNTRPHYVPMRPTTLAIALDPAAVSAI